MAKYFTERDVYEEYLRVKSQYNDQPMPKLKQDSHLFRADFYEFKELTKTLNSKQITPRLFFEANFIFREGKFYPHQFNKPTSFKNYMKYINLYKSGRLKEILKFNFINSIKFLKNENIYSIDHLALAFESGKIKKEFLAFLVFEVHSEIAKKIAVLYQIKNLIKYYWVVKRVFNQDEINRFKAVIVNIISRKVRKR